MLWKALKPEKGEVHVTWPALSLKAESPTFTDSIDYCLLMPPPAGNRKILKETKNFCCSTTELKNCKDAEETDLYLSSESKTGWICIY